VRGLAFAAAVAALAACGGPRVRTGTPLPDNIRKLAILPIVNKTQQPGLEDQLTLAVRDEFLRDARHPLVPKEESDGEVLITVTRYILTPLQYDAALNPTTYRLHVAVDVQLQDRAAGKPLWDDHGLEAALAYPYATLVGGLSEDAARQNLWAILAPMIVARVVDGFGATAAEKPPLPAANEVQ
jgi:hypothetical protein